MPLKVYNGSSWVSATALKVYNGSSWVAASSGKINYDGTQWVPFFNAGVSITTGSTTTFVSAGKGTAGYSLYSHGFSPGSSVSGNYIDYDAYYSIGYVPIGSYNSGYFSTVGGLTFTPVEVVWHSFYSDDSQLGYYEYKLRIVVTGNSGAATGGAGSYGTPFIPYVNGTAIAGAAAGEWGGPVGAGGTGQTVYTWIRGIRPNSNQAEIPGSDYDLVGSNPFGSNGSTPIITLL